jgi:hypothetical protein
VDGSDDVAVLRDPRSLDHYPRILARVLEVPAVVSITETRPRVFVEVSDPSAPDVVDRGTCPAPLLCTRVAQDGLPLIIGDARTDARVLDGSLVADHDAVAFAGWPLHVGSGRTIGSLCVLDSRPRTWTVDDLSVLADLAQACSAELQQSERHAQRAENLTRAIFDTVDVAMAFYDADDRLLLANHLAWQAADMAGFRLDVPPYAGDHVLAADNKTRVPHHEQLIPRALRGERVHGGMNWVGAPGRQIALYGSSSAVVHTDGSQWGTLIAAHDVTRLARTLQVKENFVGTVAHELRTPLTSIIAYLELVADELVLEPGRIATAMSVIERNAHELRARIDELVATAERRRTLELRSADVAGLVGRVAASLDVKARARDITLTVDAGVPQWADIDRDRVEQAVHHLVSNALKFTCPGGHVGISVSGTADAVRIAVADTGCGMTPDEVAQACELFWRAESTHRSAAQGLGIGLTFVRDTIKMHGGSCDIDSQPGRGTTFTLTFARGDLPASPTGYGRAMDGTARQPGSRRTPPRGVGVTAHGQAHLRER